MADQAKSNLEPLEEGDLNLKEKFTGGPKAEQNKIENLIPEKEIETILPVEEKIERKEGEAEKEKAYLKIVAKVQSLKPTDSALDIAADAASANEGIDAESKINNLVQLAETKGIAHAVSVARHMEDNYTLDEFHDKLLGEELHSALVKKGIIKEI